MVVEHGNADGPAPTQKSGGGIICRRFASLQFSIELVDMTVRECEAELHGGGLYVEEAVAKVVRGTFSDNVVGERGGAIDVTGALGVFNSVFLRNEAAIGGAVSYGVAEAPIGTPFDIIANTRFFRNEASQFGGALAFDYAPAFSAGNPGLPIPGGDHYVTNCTFSENVAGAAGGAISADTGSFNLIRNTITWADAAPLDREESAWRFQEPES